jgi:hypothetical protein
MDDDLTTAWLEWCSARNADPEDAGLREAFTTGWAVGYGQATDEQYNRIIIGSAKWVTE